MNTYSSVNDPEVVRLLQTGGIGVLRTDTLYGVVASATDEVAVQRVYDLKGRDERKSPIVLVSDRLQVFDAVSREHEHLLDEAWPGPVSVIIPSEDAPIWIRRDNESVAYRLPDNNELQELISQTGPLIAPSANPQSLPPAMTIQQAVDYFGDKVDFYVDGDKVIDPSPSQILQITSSGEVNRLR